METVIGIFDSTHVDRALKQLYSYGFDKSQIKLVDRDRTVEGPGAGDPVANNLNNVVVMPAQSTMGSTPNAPAGLIAYDAAAFGNDLSALGIASEASEFYRKSIENGSTVLIVKAKDEQASTARQIMRDAHASNVTEPPAHA